MLLLVPVSWLHIWTFSFRLYVAAKLCYIVIVSVMLKGYKVIFCRENYKNSKYSEHYRNWWKATALMEHQRDRWTYLFKQKWCSKLIVFHIFWFISENYKSHFPETSIINTLEFTWKRDYWTAGGAVQYISQCEISSLVAGQRSTCMYQSKVPAPTKLRVTWLS